MQLPHEHMGPSHLEIWFTNTWKSFVNFRSLGTLFHILVASYLNEFKPYIDDWTFGGMILLLSLRLYPVSLIEKMSCKKPGLILFMHLKVSIAIALRRDIYN